MAGLEFATLAEAGREFGLAFKSRHRILRLSGTVLA